MQILRAYALGDDARPGVVLLALFLLQPSQAFAGVSFYGPPVYPDDPAASIRFIAGLFDEFVGAYMDIAAERAHDPFTDADVVAQDDMRRRWLIDQLFSDPFSSKIVPFEAWTFANVPPVIRF